MGRNKKNLITKVYDIRDKSEPIREVPSKILQVHNRAVVAVQKLLNSFQEKVASRVSEAKDFDPDALVLGKH
ncbi:hypothetical protein [Legionella drancourtii]|uniref:hypothetical protein n=1 Tax=Legionella drancourtii TaxID=168933 RepID=UPI0001B01AFC|nr:hypothetical protein [Legionella drancourtii]